MKSKVPSIADVKKILKDKNIGGYNDKRVDGRRIKLLNEPLSFKKQKKLQDKFSEMYPEFNVAVGNFITADSYTSARGIRTVIHFKTRKNKFDF